MQHERYKQFCLHRFLSVFFIFLFSCCFILAPDRRHSGLVRQAGRLRENSHGSHEHDQDRKGGVLGVQAGGEDCARPRGGHHPQSAFFQVRLLLTVSSALRLFASTVYHDRFFNLIFVLCYLYVFRACLFLLKKVFYVLLSTK